MFYMEQFHLIFVCNIDATLTPLKRLNPIRLRASIVVHVFFHGIGCDVQFLTKKRPTLGRVFDSSKKLRLQTPETGSSCQCSRLKFFNVIGVQDRLAIIKNFNEMKSHNEQSLYLAGLISHEPVKRRRQRKAYDEDVI
ncbi:unnamed protein product [Psylliodes chrysocephalus]|uniref:Uncharacterized protein n=1 Tax=Psylliodes chrysocephalus TaxID=3402493 RepID=A0A9P0GH40_9CUCU|nr:unnamed protein product [Psylliodes chrysocephala]